jgi:hypothetical protein
VTTPVKLIGFSASKTAAPEWCAAIWKTAANIPIANTASFDRIHNTSVRTLYSLEISGWS